MLAKSAAPPKRLPAANAIRASLARFSRDNAGSYVVIAGLSLPVIIGSVSLGAEVGLWYYKHQAMQGATDSAALSAAAASVVGESNLTLQASAITASYGFVSGSNGVTLTVNHPPLSGPNQSNSYAVEVLVQGPQPRFFSQIFDARPLTVAARSVAVAGSQGCVLALDPSASGAISLQGSNTVSLNGCSLFNNSNSGTAMNVGGSAALSAQFVGVVGGVSGLSNITSTMGVKTNSLPMPDPYANVSFPSFSGCNQNNYTTSGTETIQPGVYCGGMTFKAGANVTLAPGIYYLDQGSFSAAGQSTIQGTGVTLVFTSSTGNNFASATSTGGATINLTAPTSGPLAGIVVFGDRRMPPSTTFKFVGGGTQNFGGAIYLPKGSLSYAGGAGAASSCTQIIGGTINFVGNSSLAVNCAAYNTKALGASLAALVE